ncbi:hypothetical protein FMO003_35060 [Moritella sp. F3]|nr:hypothetical protein FMO001_19730 [Moritella sp. F1]GIC83226.1 hypothetical protein FMO003_35060 [Moritella sp. F3]
MSVLIFIFYSVNHPRPIDLISNDELDVVNWIKNNTEEGSIIISPPNKFLKTTIPLLTGRGTYYGNGVPFDSTCIEDNYTRYVNVYGKTTSSNGRMKAQEFYDKLDKGSLNMLKPKADYIITENSNFSDKSIKVNDKFYIYKINND